MNIKFELNDLDYPRHYLWVHLHFTFEIKKSWKGVLSIASSIGLDFLNPTSQLRHTNVTAFCMQLGNRLVMITRSVYMYSVTLCTPEK